MCKGDGVAAKGVAVMAWHLDVENRDRAIELALILHEMTADLPLDVDPSHKIPQLCGELVNRLVFNEEEYPPVWEGGKHDAA
jgi:hypothetical protein